MRHIIFGGDGFVGRHLAPKLLADGQEVIVADIVKSEEVLSYFDTLPVGMFDLPKGIPA